MGIHVLHTANFRNIILLEFRPKWQTPTPAWDEDSQGKNSKQITFS